MHGSPLMSRRSIDAIALVALVTLVLVVWGVDLFASALKPLDFTLENADFYLQIYPMEYRAAAVIRSGALPLWNPYQFAGQPFLATGIYGVLYPLNVVYLLFPTAWAIEIVTVLHLAIAGVGTYTWARTVNMGPIGAATAALTYMLSGFLVKEANWFTPALASAAWLPLALTAIERLARRGSTRWSFVLGTATAFAFLAGWPQTWLYSLYVVAVYATARLGAALVVRESRRDAAAAALRVAIGMVVAFGLIAAQLLPSLELQHLGPRHAGALSLRQITPFGHATPHALLAGMLDSARGTPRPTYLGIATLLLMPLAAGIGRARAAVAGCMALLAAFSIAVYLNSPALELYLALPGMASFRFPARMILLYAVAGAALAGMGVEALGRARDRRVTVALVLVAPALWGALAWWTGVSVPPLSALYGGVALLLMLAAAWSRGNVRDALRLCVVVLLAWDLFYAVRNDYMRPVHNPESFDTQSALWSYIREHQHLDRTYIVPPTVGERAAPGVPPQITMMEKQGTLQQIYSITDYEPLSLSRYRSFFALLQGPLPEHLLFTGRLHADPSRPEFRLLDLMSVRYCALPVEDATMLAGITRRPADWRRLSVPGTDQYHLFERTDVLPRAYVAFNVRPVRDEAEALGAIQHVDFDPRRAVVLEDATRTTGARASGAISAARITAYEPTRVVIETDTAADGELVLTDTFYPGWYASVDGQTRPIHRANYLFRAVAVPAGRHVVTFWYAPRSFRLGATITAATLALTLVALARRRRPGYRTPAPTR